MSKDRPEKNERSPDEVNRDAARKEMRNIGLWGMLNTFHSQNKLTNARIRELGETDLQEIPYGGITITNNNPEPKPNGWGRAAGVALLTTLATAAGFGGASLLNQEPAPEIIPIDAVIEWSSPNAPSGPSNISESSSSDRGSNNGGTANSPAGSPADRFFSIPRIGASGPE